MFYNFADCTSPFQVYVYTDTTADPTIAYSRGSSS